MPSVIYAECRKNAYYAECRYTECHMLSFVMLSVIMLSVVRANFVAPLQPTLIFQLKLLHSKGACKALHSCPNHKR
jgi:hypothetical protein